MKHRLELSETISFDTQIADGKSVKIQKESYVTVVTENGEVNTERFYFIKDLPVSLVIGTDLLYKYDAQIDFKKFQMTFDGKDVLIFKDGESEDQPQKHYIDKFCLNKDGRSYPCVEDFIKFYDEKNLNNRIKCIPIKTKLIYEDNLYSVTRSKSHTNIKM